MKRILKSIGIEIMSTGLIGGLLFLIDGGKFDFIKFVLVCAGLGLLFNISIKFLRKYLARKAERKINRNV